MDEREIIFLLEETGLVEFESPDSIITIWLRKVLWGKKRYVFQLNSRYAGSCRSRDIAIKHISSMLEKGFRLV